MKNFRRLTKWLLFIIFTVFAIAIVYEGYNLTYVIISAILIFSFEFLYYLIENKSDVILISNNNNSSHKRNSIILLAFSGLSLFFNIYDETLTIKNSIPSIIFGFIGLRGLMFPKQTVAAIRIFNEGFEYGFWNRFVSWNRISNYNKSDDNLKIMIKGNGWFRKNIVIKFDKLEDS